MGSATATVEATDTLSLIGSATDALSVMVSATVEATDDALNELLTLVKNLSTDLRLSDIVVISAFVSSSVIISKISSICFDCFCSNDSFLYDFLHGNKQTFDDKYLLDGNKINPDDELLDECCLDERVLDECCLDERVLDECCLDECCLDECCLDECLDECCLDDCLDLDEYDLFILYQLGRNL